MTIKINKNFFVIAIALLIVIIGIWFGVSKYLDYKHWQSPMYESKKEEILLSSDVDKLSDEQEQRFYDLSHSIINSERPDTDFDNDFTDKSLFVKKMGKSKFYYVQFVCRYEPMKMNFTTSYTIRIESPTLKGETHYTYWDYESDLSDY